MVDPPQARPGRAEPGFAPSTEPDVLVVGGGLAGIAAALRCADHGRRVTVVEGRPRLGGEAFSFLRGDLVVDNGQHVFLRCCTAYQWLLSRIGATDRVALQPRLDIPVLRSDGARGRLFRAPGLPAPVHLGTALASYRLLSLPDRARAVRGALAVKRLDPDDPRLDGQRLGDYLRGHGQPQTVIDALWGIVTTATLNIAAQDASLALAAKVFRTGLLDRASAADVGYAAAPLGELHSDRAGVALAASGVEVRLSHRVASVKPGGEVVVRHRGALHSCWPQTVILAIPPREAFAAVPELAETPARAAQRLDTSPIINVHVIYDKQVTDLDFAAAVGSPAQWIFDRTRASRLHNVRPKAQYLAVTVSAADEFIDVPSAALRKRFLTELANLLPGARQAGVVDAFITRERHATFRQAAGANRLRPGPADGPDGVWLAGAWTATGWPDTMESAVRSGVRAAESAMGLAPVGMMDFDS